MQNTMYFHLVIALHPDGESELEASGNMDINTPLVQLFLAMQNIRSRAVSHKLYAYAQQGNMPVEWELQIPQLKQFAESIAAAQKQTLEWSFQCVTARSTYDHNMHFQFAHQNDWLYMITPRAIDEDLYGTDHGMFEHIIVQVSDIFQTALIQRILSKWELSYRAIVGEDVEGFVMYAKQPNLGVYGGREGFQKRFMEEVASLFKQFQQAGVGHQYVVTAEVLPGLPTGDHKEPTKA